MVNNEFSHNNNQDRLSNPLFNLTEILFETSKLELIQSNKPYSPEKSALRFSKKADVPSAKSSVPKQLPNSSISTS